MVSSAAGIHAKRSCRWLHGPTTLIGIFCLLLTNCASMARGHTQRVSVDSEPQGALIYEGTDLLGTTPALVILDRQNLVLRFEKEGYEPRELAIKRKLSGWIVADIALGVVPSLGVLSSGTSSKWEAAGALTIFGGVPAGAYIGIDLLNRSAWTLPASVRVFLRPKDQR